MTWKCEVLQIHHTASPRDTTTFEDVEKWHKARGFAKIGYSYLITADGVIHKGRAEGLELAACKGHNKNAIAISVCGNFENEVPTEEQLHALFNLVSEVKDRYPDVQVKGHRDLAATACPGKNLYALIKDL